ncbi:predicted protein [Nematostella vectensis]|uniref:F-box domain-containing protein n=1 Tax=Nematostella vectensis TaxID=45351 RepID=A7SJ73_NEMVE|nr:F-box only protein 7 isoform X2 [Nematostella vectensis]EDO36247.1 predicted protein [Nematostella vectensis]|eukprot:XP_001628310.1 predicted protein [Nematostella vectensis]
MKLRIRFGSRRELLDFPGLDDVTAQEVEDSVSNLLSLQNGNYFLSLNGTSPLTEDKYLNLSELGIVSGDLIHVVMCRGVECTSASPAVQVAQVSGPQAVDTTSPSTSTDSGAMEREDERCSGKSTDKRIRTESQQSLSALSAQEVTVKHIKISDKIDESEAGSSAPEESSSGGSGSGCAVNVMQPRVLRLQDGISYLLEKTYNQADVSTLHEAVCVAVHVLMLETCFNPVTKKDDEGSKSDKSEFRDQPLFIGSGWKTKRGMEFQYIHPACPGTSCYIVCASLGPFVLAHGVTEGSEIHKCHIPAAEYVRGNVDLKRKGAVDVFHNLARLSRMVKDHVVYPLLSSMRHELDLPELYGFMAIPSEVKIMVLSLLPVRSILAMSSLCRELNSITNDNTLWHHLCFRDFGTSHRNHVTNWKVEYVRIYKEKRVTRIYPPLYMSPEWITGRSPASMFPEGPPGIIGGRSDVYPNLPFMPGGFHQPGHAPGPGMHPRFDPFGPVPEMDLFPGRHPRGPGRGRGRGPFGGNPPGPFF